MGLARLASRALEARDGALSLSDYAQAWQQFSHNGVVYTVPDRSAVTGSSSTYYGSNSIVFAVTSQRIHHFAQIRFKFQAWNNGRPGDLFGTAALGLLEQPSPGMTTGDLLGMMLLDETLYGNSYWVVRGGDLVRLDPTKVTVVYADVIDPQSELGIGQVLLGYAYRPDPWGTAVAGFNAREVAHFWPTPSSTPFVGQSWLSAVLPDVAADQQMTVHKLSFLKNGAIPGIAVTYPAPAQGGPNQEQFRQLIDLVEANHAGVLQAGKTLHLAGGADVKTVGMSFDQLAFKATQGAGETRIASAAGMPPVVVGLSEGLSGSSLNAGNYNSARRRLADGTMRPLWQRACEALASLVAVPAGARLWYDDRDVPFLQEDVADDAEIRVKHATAMETLIRAGYTPDSVRVAVTTGDFSVLQHTGLYSVQLQPPGAGQGPTAQGATNDG